MFPLLQRLRRVRAVQGVKREYARALEARAAGKEFSAPILGSMIFDLAGLILCCWSCVLVAVWIASELRPDPTPLMISLVVLGFSAVTAYAVWCYLSLWTSAKRLLFQYLAIDEHFASYRQSVVQALGEDAVCELEAGHPSTRTTRA